MFILNKKIHNSKFVIRNCQKGMTYVEIIVVLSIFSVMTSVVLFNYGAFQSKVDIKNLATDIALAIVEAQKSSLSGKLPPQAPTISPWKPAYGLYFDYFSDDKSFIYFTDLNNSNFFNDSDCSGECLKKITITKGNYISKIERYSSSSPTPINFPFSLTFKRPDSGATFSFGDGTSLTGFDYIQITIASPQSLSSTATIKIYPSGRVQVN